MYGINVIYTMKPGKREEFLAGVTASGAQAAVRGEEGCLQYDYFTSVDNPDKLLLLEKWTTREAQKVHMGQPHRHYRKGSYPPCQVPGRATGSPVQVP